MNPANHPDLNSWIKVDADSDFPIQNLPLGIYTSLKKTNPRVCTIIGNRIIDIAALAERGYLDGLNIDRMVFYNRYLNDFINLGKKKTSGLRNRISEIFRDYPVSPFSALRTNWAHQEKILDDFNTVTLHLPVKIGDYTDFYSSREHATNVGSMFRDPNNALLPNWKHLPVAYHGRASSIIVSGTNIHRPLGQTKAEDESMPSFGPTKQLDFELEMAFITHQGKPMGERIMAEEAEDYIFGMVLFNDWSARDIQKWEYVPLGPFLSKNFASSVSPWVVMLDALDPFRTDGPEQAPEVLPYLKYKGKKNFDINLEVYIKPHNSAETLVSRSNTKYLYWNIVQQLVHHTVNGCNINTGDLMASGTISGPTPDSYGSMLELAWKGTKPIKMPDGSDRKFILDSDTVIMKGYAEKQGVKIGFGEVRSMVLPSL